MRSMFTTQDGKLVRPEENMTVFGGRIGFIRSVFGCWHRNLSRPFTYGKKSYRMCLKCGARKNFDTETMTTSGAFYYPPSPPHDGFLY